MKILYIASSNIKGGATIALINIIKGMKAHGHEILVALPLGEGYLPQTLDTLQIPFVHINSALSVYPVNPNPILYPLRLLYTLYRQIVGTQQLVSIIRTIKPDIVHTNVGPMSIGYYACKLTNKPHVWHQREYQDLDFNLHFFPSEKSFFQKSHSPNNYNICITKGIAQYRNFTRTQDRVIYDGVFSMEELAYLPKRAPQNVILYVGRIELGKGLYELLEAFYIFHIAHPEYRLEVLGGTPPDSKNYEHKCIEFIKDNGLEKEIVFRGYQNDVYDFMSVAKMLIVPSSFEGFGFITAESMAVGCPVIGRNTAGTKEQFDNGRKHTGKEIGFRFSNNEEMLDAMETIISTDTTDLCQRAKKTVFDLYTQEKNVENIENYYKEILSKKK